MLDFDLRYKYINKVVFFKSGVALIVAWWVLGSSAILIARYFKPLFPRKKLLGTAVWFQVLHLPALSICTMYFRNFCYKQRRIRKMDGSDVQKTSFPSSCIATSS